MFHQDVLIVFYDNFSIYGMKSIGKIFPDFKTIFKHIPVILRSSLIGVGIGSVPGIGEVIAG